jgi:nucleotide-binding universal stress UspA family protein
VSPAKRKVIRAGRRGGKTVGMAILALEAFHDRDARVLYAVPTADQLGAFWGEVATACAEPVADGAYRQNLTEHLIENLATGARIRGKTAWNADSLRGDWASILILDEWQLMDEDAWELVGAPMMLDTNGTAVFVYTPPSLRSRSASKARDPQHAAKLWKKAVASEQAARQGGQPSRWASFHFRSSDNPHLSTDGLLEIAQDMTPLAYRMEIEAEDVDEAPGALWTRAAIEAGRIDEAQRPALVRTLVAVDPTGTKTGAEAGIMGGGTDAAGHEYLLEDGSLHARPEEWAAAAIALARKLKAPAIVAEANFGGEMVQSVINQIDPTMPVILVNAADGKRIRAVPVAVKYAQGKVHHVGRFDKLEDEMCLWTENDPSPNRLDALVWLLSTQPTYDSIERWAKSRRPKA